MTAMRTEVSRMRASSGVAVWIGRTIVKGSLPDQRPYSRGRYIHGNHYTRLSETTTGVPS
jgi:hypothetical protein